MEKLRNHILGGLFGEAIGDALGVPVEFKSRKYLEANPIADFIGYGCWNQPPGTFSDDSSMMFCTAEALVQGYNINLIADNFVKWYKEGYWGAHDKVFDVGGTTRRSLDRILAGESPLFSGEFDIENNGNGSLMRILPLIFYLLNEKDINARYNIVKDVSSITHSHFRSVLSCFIFVEFGICIIKMGDLGSAYKEMQKNINEYALVRNFNPTELKLFDKILKYKIWEYDDEQISTFGYVLDSLESSLWCLFRTKSYKEAVLKAVNLGGDTDTTAAITGGIAGIYYGFDDIEKKWIDGVAKKMLILDLADRFYKINEKF